MKPDAQLEFATQVVNRLVGAGFEALWAGGCVRDLLLGRTPKDYDVATNARPEQVRELFGRRRTLAVGESFGVIVVLGSKAAGQVEVATYRTDGDYLDGRRPDSVTYCTAVEDAKRRDFTINGMFFDPLNERVLDFVGGERDLAAGIIRAIGDPAARMEEDKLRMLRAVRFAATFEFHLDEDTAAAVRSMAPQIDAVSTERIAAELRRMLGHEHRDRALQLSHDVNLQAEIIPELTSVVKDEHEWGRLKMQLRLLGDAEFPVALAAVFIAIVSLDRESGGDAASTVETAGKRLRFSNREIADAAWLVSHREALKDAARQSLAQLKRLLAERLSRDLIRLDRSAALAMDSDAADADFCEQFLERHAVDDINPQPLLTGRMLIQRGYQPGPAFKDVLDGVRDAQLNLEISTAEEAMALAERLLHVTESTSPRNEHDSH